MAKSNLSYKKATTITLKAAGLVDIQNGTINVDGEDTPILSFFKDADGLEVEFAWKIKSEEDLDSNFSDEFNPDEESDD